MSSSLSLSKKALGLFRQSLRLAAAHSMYVIDVHFARLQAEMCFPSRTCHSGKQILIYFAALRQNSTRFFDRLKEELTGVSSSFFVHA